MKNVNLIVTDMKNVNLSVTARKPIEFEKAIYVKEFTTTAFQDFHREFHKLHSNDEIGIIPIIIHSYGGQVDTLLAMLDVIQASNKPVATITAGVAMSCAAVLLAAGTKGYRFASPNAQIMIHQMSSGTNGKMSDLEIDIKQTKKISNKFLSLLNKFAGQPKNFFQSLIKRKNFSDVYLTSKDCKKLGLVDYIAIPNLV